MFIFVHVTGIYSYLACHPLCERVANVNGVRPVHMQLTPIGQEGIGAGFLRLFFICTARDDFPRHCIDTLMFLPNIRANSYVRPCLLGFLRCHMCRSSICRLLKIVFDFMPIINLADIRVLSVIPHISIITRNI